MKRSKNPLRNPIRNTLIDAYIDYDNIHNLSLKEFKEICKTCNQLLTDAIINTGYSFKLPKLLGLMSVVKVKGSPNRTYIDFGHFQKTGEVIRFKNRHSDGYYAKFEWNKNLPYCKIFNKKYFKFIPLRYSKRALARAIIDRNTINKYFT